jgi:signal transduction histidine kinase/ActR/RegA family two-component response regulator
MVEVDEPPTYGPDDEFARLSILQELTIASTALFDPGEPLDRFLELLGARLGSPVAICIEVGADGKVRLVGDAGLSSASRSLPIAPWPQPLDTGPADIKQALPYHEVHSPDLGCWQFRLACPDRGRGTAVWLVLMFGHGAFPSSRYRSIIERLTSTLRAALRQREAAAALLAGTARLAAANADLTREIEVRERAEATLRKTEEQLRQAQKMEAVGRLAGGLAHDFNNLLMVIGGCSVVLRKQIPPGDRLREPLDLIANAAEQAGALTQQLLAFSRQQVLNPGAVDINELVAETQTMLRRMIGEDVEIVSTLDPDVGAVLADRGQLAQLLMNLAVNARDAMPDGGRLTIETARRDLDVGSTLELVGVPPGPYVLLSVSDTGVGMDAETKAHLFEPFFTTKELGKGTGLGLCTVYGTVKQSGGAIVVESEANRGTSFKIYLPSVGGSRTSEPPSVRSGGRSGPDTAVGTVLLVEDNAMVRGVLERFVVSSGYRILVAASGDEALALSAAHDGRIDLLLSDVIMPRMSGAELASKLAETRPDIAVVLISGFASTESISARSLGRRASFLQKPFTEDALAEKLRSALAPKPAR